jgi:peptide deformylase
MILPIVAYGTPVLKMKAADVSADYKKLDQLIANMWETMYAASGVGLAAPQVGLGLRLFVIDGLLTKAVYLSQMFVKMSNEKSSSQLAIKTKLENNSQKPTQVLLQESYSTNMTILKGYCLLINSRP